jgi:hypothetical protein
MLSLAREALITISNKEVLLNTALADMIKISPYYAELSYESGFENLNKIKLIADGERIECLGGEQLRCKYALFYGSLTLCQCPLLNYIAKNFNM